MQSAASCSRWVCPHASRLMKKSCPCLQCSKNAVGKRIRKRHFCRSPLLPQQWNWRQARLRLLSAECRMNALPGHPRWGCKKSADARDAWRRDARSLSPGRASRGPAGAFARTSRGKPQRSSRKNVVQISLRDSRSGRRRIIRRRRSPAPADCSCPSSPSWSRNPCRCQDRESIQSISSPTASC
jgi:hypothetical protein